MTIFAAKLSQFFFPLIQYSIIPMILMIGSPDFEKAFYHS